MIIGPFVLL